MESKELLKKAASVLRDTAKDRDGKAEELKKTAAEKEKVEKELRAYKSVCQMADDGYIDVSDIQEKVAALLNDEDSFREETNLTRLMDNGIGTIKKASADIGGSDPLTDYLTNLGGF